MTHSIPLSIEIRNLDREIKRTQNYLQYYRENINKLDLSCCEKCSDLSCLLEDQNSSEEKRPSQISSQLADNMIEVLSQQLKLVALYEDEEKILRQMRLKIKEREELVEKMEQRNEEFIKQEWKKEDIKEMKLFQKENSRDEDFSFSLSQENYNFSKKRSFQEPQTAQFTNFTNKCKRKLQ